MPILTLKSKKKVIVNVVSLREDYYKYNDFGLTPNDWEVYVESV
jgi:hypothetical protein